MRNNLNIKKIKKQNFLHMTSITKKDLIFNFNLTNEVLGVGNYGLVQKIIKKSTKKEFALKTIHCQNLEHLSAALQEILINFKAQSDCIINVHYYFIDKSADLDKFILGIIMELGIRNLYQDILFRAKNYKIYENKVIYGLLIKIVNALSDLQIKQIAHRDIKPDNFIVFENGEIKLIDFGLSKIQFVRI